jgi:hypothetical protein
MGCDAVPDPRDRSGATLSVAGRWPHRRGGRVEQRGAAETEVSVEERVRALGFDPGQLTPGEQEELLEFDRLCPDEALTV